MKKIILFILIPFILIGQKKNKHNISWESKFLFESNDLNKGFLNSILYDGYITEDMKYNWTNSRHNKNIINSEIINRLIYRYNFNTENG